MQDFIHLHSLVPQCPKTFSAFFRRGQGQAPFGAAIFESTAGARKPEVHFARVAPQISVNTLW